MFEIPSMKDFNLSARYQTLKKSEFLVPDPNDSDKIIISVKGKNLLDSLNIINEDKPGTGGDSFKVTLNKNWVGKATPTVGQCFEEWWKAFPTSPAWISDDKKVQFIGSRSLKNLTKAKAKERYLKLLNQGLLHEDLLGSLKYEINLKKQDSIKKNANQMEYFKGMESYFNQERYLLYIDSYKSNPQYVNQINAKKSNVTDI